MESVKSFCDVASICVVVGTLLGYLPALAAVFTLIWTGMQIYDRIKFGRRK